MNNLVKALETIGQTQSIKQFNSIDEMKEKLNIKNDILSKIEKAEVEYFCQQEPGDEE